MLFSLAAHCPRFLSSQRDISSCQLIELHPHLTCSLPVWSDICLKEVPSIADSLYNIQLLREFASEYLNKSCYLTMEDMLYSPLVLKVRNTDRISFYFPYWKSIYHSTAAFKCHHFSPLKRLWPFFLLCLQHNVMVFIAELFWWFETVKPEFVQPRDLQEFKDGKPHVERNPIASLSDQSFPLS